MEWKTTAATKFGPIYIADAIDLLPITRGTTADARQTAKMHKHRRLVSSSDVRDERECYLAIEQKVVVKSLYMCPRACKYICKVFSYDRETE